MDDEVIKVFVTMKANPDMKMSAWQHALDELSNLIAQANVESSWGSVNMYGPDCGAFSYFPAVCAEMELPAQVIVCFQETLSDSPWFKEVAVNVTRAA